MKKIQLALLSGMIAAAGAGVAFTTSPDQPDGYYASGSSESESPDKAASTGKDITVTNITAPATVTPGNTFEVAVTLKTIGTVASSSHKLALYVDGVALETKTPPSLPVDSSQVVTFTVPTNPLDVDPYKIYAKATLSRDDNTANNVSDTITVGITLSTLPKVTDLTAKGDMDKVVLNWGAPQNAGQTFKGYNVWSNRTLLTETPITATTYTIESPSMGNTYVVTAVYENGQSAASNAVTPELNLPNGDGTAANPYKVSNVKEFTFFLGMTKASECEGLYFLQTNDIDFEKQSISLTASTKQFKGNYDGGGHALNNLRLISSGVQYAGMISNLGATGKISNLTLDGTAIISAISNAPLVGNCYGTIENVVSKMTISSDKGQTGGIVSEVYANAVCKNCEFSGTINSAAAYACVGGIAGRTNHGTFENCKFTGSILNPTNAANVSYVGGIAGYAYPSAFINCTSDGVLPADEQGNYRGGIAGFAYASTAAANSGDFTFKNCVNRSKVMGATYIGGICGYAAFMKATGANYKNKSTMTVDSCVNYGDIHTTGEMVHTGGILGSYTMSTKVTNCDNYGNVTGNNAIGMGGIVGAYMENPTDSTQSFIKNCRNFGYVKSLTPEKGYASYMGGIIGDVTQWTTIENCENYGEVVSSGYVGGIAGYGFWESIKVYNCTNYADVTANFHTAAGIIGFNYNYTNEVRNCINHGNITSLNTDSIGYSVAGIAGASAGTYENNLNTGTIIGADYVGGINAYTKTGYLSIKNNLNTGKVIARQVVNGDTVYNINDCGAIIGLPVDSSYFWKPEWDKESGNYYTPNVLSAYPAVTADYVAHHAGTEISDLDLVNTDKLGADWKAFDAYCWPTPVGSLNQGDMTKVWAAQVVPGKAEETLSDLRTNFFVGAPEGLVWKATPAYVTFEGTNAILAKKAKDHVVLTATCGDYSKSVEIDINTQDGVDSLEADDAVEEMWFDMQGVRVERPATADGNVYIMLRRYADGTVKAVKVIN